MEIANATRTAYGKACANCARVKYKCVYRLDGDGCERCHRLKKPCQPSVYQRKRKLSDAALPVQNRHTRHVARTADTGHQSPPHTTETRARYFDDLMPDLTNDVGGAPLSKKTNHGSPMTPISYSQDLPTAPAASYTSPTIASDVSEHHIPDAVADEQLNMFRQYFLSALPFMHIPTDVRAADLRMRTPFVWLVIMSLTTRSSAQQIRMGEASRAIVAKRVMAGCEKTLDAILAIVCYIGWFQLHRKDKASLVMWTQIAVSILTELGLHKEPLRSQEDFDSAQFSTKYSNFPLRKQISPLRTVEERRTALAVWLTTSMWVLASMIWSSFTDSEEGVA
ncbi:hypothetical protein BDV96DRAFT_26138 [Lophiotrema nucula]|uniref:Zn(2)-C6 fungal-type domain-containing protein n=1 Tax=Lophiotrema nucula TaxID=690887 RepID=A0A6A5ZDB9_9PLEO|nr:hypothetical protein BDV96DRAFT_26138 [Lophiotrema nucula]